MEQEIARIDLAAERELLKKAFNQERNNVLAALPSTYKSLWGRVGFAKTNWGNEWLPCLFLGPYDVSPTSAMRQLWMETFNKAESKTTLPVLVYWYGSTNPSTAHSLVPYSCVQTCLVRRNLVKLPLSLKQKVDSGRTDLFTWEERGRYRAFYELNQDLTRGTPRRETFRELYEDDNYVLSVLATKGRTVKATLAVSSPATSRMAPKRDQSEASFDNKKYSLAESDGNKKPRHSKVIEEHSAVAEADWRKQPPAVEAKESGPNNEIATDNTANIGASTPVSKETTGAKSTVASNPSPAKPSGGVTNIGWVHASPPLSYWPQPSPMFQQPPPPPSTPVRAPVFQHSNGHDTVDGSDEMMMKVANMFTSILSPVKECHAQIQHISQDVSLNEEDMFEASIFWRKQMERWKQCLPFFASESTDETTETILNNVKQFMAIIEVIKDCQEQIKVLIKDTSRTRLDIAQESLLWRKQEKEWKKRLPYFHECMSEFRG